MGLFSSFRPRAAPASASHWRRGDFVALPLGPALSCVLRRHQAAVTLPEFLVEFSHACEDFQPLERAIEEYADRHGWDAMQVAALRRLLPQAITDGLLVSTDDLRKAVLRHETEPSVAPPRIETLGFSTGGDRLPLLERAVRSFASNQRAHGRKATFLISENSRDPVRTDACREAARRWSADLPEIAFRFAGEQEKRRFTERLSQAGVCSRETAEFALLDPIDAGFSLGANRNALLLQTAGHLFSSLDDDAVCRLAAPPDEATAALSCVSDTDPYDRRLYGSRADAMADVEWREADYLGLHEQLLGKTPAELFAAAPTIDFARTGDGLLQRLLRGPTRVRATYTGHLGDPGIPTSAYYLYYDGQNRERLVETPEHYEAVFGSRSVLTVSPTPALADSSVCPGIALALDHRELLPPFFPVLHAEDYSWGAVLWRSCPGALIGHLPLAVCHEPGEGKPILTPAGIRAGPPFILFEFAHLLRQIVLRAPMPEEGTAADRLLALGRHLQDIGRLPTRDFREFLNEQALSQASDRVAYLTHQLEEAPDLPDYWREDVQSLIGHLQTSAVTPDCDIPLDLQGRRSPAETRVFMQTLIGRYGSLLIDWPAMVGAARGWCEAGEGPMPLL